MCPSLVLSLSLSLHSLSLSPLTPSLVSPFFSHLSLSLSLSLFSLSLSHTILSMSLYLSRLLSPSLSFSYPGHTHSSRCYSVHSHGKSMHTYRSCKLLCKHCPCWTQPRPIHGQRSIESHRQLTPKSPRLTPKSKPRASKPTKLFSPQDRGGPSQHSERCWPPGRTQEPRQRFWRASPASRRSWPQ